ncbi:MAG: CvpA family protein [Planctomycetes bacterium]|nr:CvpA family protein [Planctomycetota bacterium]
MNWLDASIIVLLALGATFGALTGAFWQVARVTMVVLGAIASMRWGSWASSALETRFSPAVASLFGYFLAFLFVYLAAFAVCTMIDSGLKLSDLKWLDRVLGSVLGTTKAAAAVLVALAGLSMVPTPEFTADMHHSMLAPAMLRGAETVLPVEAKARVRWLLDEANRRLEPLYGDATDAPRAFASALAPEGQR